MKKLAFLVIFALSACSTDALVNTAYPDRERFAFRTTDGEDIFVYACAKGATEQATKARANTAHRYFNRGMDQIVARAVDDTFSGSRSISVLRTLDKGAEALVNQTEDRYQCLFIDARDV